MKKMYCVLVMSILFLFQSNLVMGQIVVKSPNGGESWSSSSNQNIEWASQQSPGLVTIHLTTDNGTTWTPIFTNIASQPGDNVVAWSVVPNTSSAACKIKVIDNADDSSDISNANFTIRLEAPVLGNPASGSLYDSTKFYFFWAAVPGASKYEIQICKSSEFTSSDLKTYTTVNTSPLYSPADYLDAGQKYYWRVRTLGGTIYSEYSSVNDVTVTTPSSLISDADVDIILDHSNGRISQITFKTGQGAVPPQLLDTILNNNNRTGLCRINNETLTKLASWNETVPGSYVYTYNNSTYRSKTVTINWSASGITVDMNVGLSSGKVAVTEAAWRPGGNIGPMHDYILCAKDTVFTRSYISYPVSIASLYNGSADLFALYDDRYPEYFGFNSEAAVPATVQMSSSMLGIKFSYPSKADTQSVNLSFAIKADKTEYFLWAQKNYILVTSPLAGEKLNDLLGPTVTWDGFGDISANVNIELSEDGGSTFNPLSSNIPLTDYSAPVTLGPVPSTQLAFRVADADSNNHSGCSGVFSNYGPSVEPTARFSISNSITGSPTDIVAVPIEITPAAGADISSFDIRLEYDKTVLSYVNKMVDIDFAGWSININDNLTYLQIGGYNISGNIIDDVTKPDTFMILLFSVKTTATVGTSTLLKINNDKLSVANSAAVVSKPLAVDGKVTLYGRVSGSLKYFVSQKPIGGADIITFKDAENGDVSATSNTLTGFFDFTNKKPGSSVIISPDTNRTAQPLISNPITAEDAAKTFAGREGGSKPLSDIQKIAADVNGDGVVNSVDAFAILKQSADPAFFATNFTTGWSPWLFINANYKLTSTNWPSAPRTFEYTPLNLVQAKQNFWGMIRGDVDGSYAPDTTGLNKGESGETTSGNLSGTVCYSIPANLSALPGDTVYIPLNIALNGKTVGAFNASVQIDQNKLSYTGIWHIGASLSLNKKWTITTHYDSKGSINVAATEFSDAISSIAKDGPLVTFVCVINKDAALGDSIAIKLANISVGDVNLIHLQASSINGKIYIGNNLSANGGPVKEFFVTQNYPNPFNPVTTINFGIPEASIVSMKIFDVTGREVVTLINGQLGPGYHSSTWNAQGISSGIYFYRIVATPIQGENKNSFTEIKKLLLMK